MENFEEFTINEIATKCRSKKKMYNVITREGQLYLPPEKDATQNFLRSLMQGDKKWIIWDKVKVIKIPQYEGLKVKHVLKFAASKIDIEEYLLSYDYPKEPNREWLWNIVNSLIPEEFKSFVDHQIDKRLKKLVQNQNLKVTASKNFIDIFKASKWISMEKEKSYFLARAPQKSLQQLKIEKYQKEKIDDSDLINNLRNKINDLNSKLDEFEKKQQLNEDYTDKMSRLYDLGIIDEDGNPISSEMKIGYYVDLTFRSINGLTFL